MMDFVINDRKKYGQWAAKSNLQTSKIESARAARFY